MAYGDYHLLSYDADLRMTKDSSLSGSGLVTYFTYPNGNIAITTLPEGTPDDNFIDTAYVSNGNVSTETNWFPQVPGGANVNSGEAWFNYVSAANPAYHPAISRSIGPLLFNWTFSNSGEFVDFISKNVYQKETNTGEFAPLAVSSLNYSITTDSKGRLAKLISSGGASTSAATIVFNYY